MANEILDPQKVITEGTCFLYCRNGPLCNEDLPNACLGFRPPAETKRPLPSPKSPAPQSQLTKNTQK